MIDYSKWPRKKIFTTSLKLDDQNPRLPTTVTGLPHRQNQIINYLIEQENVYPLARTIAIQGYFPNEEPLVYKEGDKYIVVEGNRRVAACKILLHPDLLTNSAKQKNIGKLLENFNIDQIKRLEVRVAPSRESADVIIVNRHTEGAPIEKWDKTKQDRFYYNRLKGGESIDDLSQKFNMPKSSIKDGLKRFHVYEELVSIDLPEHTKAQVKNEATFSMTNVERFYNSKSGKEFLGLEFDSTGSIIHLLPKDEYDKRLKIIAQWVVDEKLNSRTFGSEAQQKELVEKMREAPGLSLSVAPNRKNQDGYNISINEVDEELTPKAANRTHTHGRQTPQNKLIGSDIIWFTGVERIDTIFKELKAANLNSQFNSTAVLFRSYLDMLVYQYLKKSDGLKELIKEEQQKLIVEHSKRKERLIQFITNLGVKASAIDEKELDKV